ncbi:hypothetical protein GCM10027402_22320 [Arthrobacter monumenti]
MQNFLWAIYDGHIDALVDKYASGQVGQSDTGVSCINGRRDHHRVLNVEFEPDRASPSRGTIRTGLPDKSGSQQCVDPLGNSHSG